MNEEICCINNKEKTAKNEWENGDSDFLQSLCNVYKNLDNCFSVLSHYLVEGKIHLFC